MQVRPMTQGEKDRLEAHCKEYHLWDRTVTFTCSYCGARINYQQYAGHVEKFHKWNGGHIYRPFPKTKVNAVLLFAELQQRDATLEELAEGGE